MSVASLCQVVSKSPGGKKRQWCMFAFLSWPQSPQPKLARFLLHATFLFRPSPCLRSLSLVTPIDVSHNVKKQRCWRSPHYANALVVSRLEFRQLRRNCHWKFGSDVNVYSFRRGYCIVHKHSLHVVLLPNSCIMLHN